MPRRRQPRIRGPMLAFTPRVRACLAYAASSAAVMLMNKVVFSHASFNYPWSTLAFQNTISCATILAARAARLTSHRLYIRPLARAMPVPIAAFVAFIFTNAQSLRYVNIPVLTVWKSLGPMFVTLSEAFFFGDAFPSAVYLSMGLIVLSALVTAINDLEYSPVGYCWAAANVAANVLYLGSLRAYLRDTRAGPLEKTFHSNLLSLLAIVPLAIANGEFPGVFRALAVRGPWFQAAFVLSGCLTTAVCASAFWTIAVTNGSTLSFIGGFNKAPIILLSLLMFDVRVSRAGWLGVGLGFVAGVVFIRAKTVSAGDDGVRKTLDDGRGDVRMSFKEDLEGKQVQGAQR